MDNMALTVSTRRAEARRFVQSISESHGYLGEEFYASAGMSAESRRKVENAMLAKDKIIGSSVITYASLPSCTNEWK